MNGTEKTRDPFDWVLSIVEVSSLFVFFAVSSSLFFSELIRSDVCCVLSLSLSRRLRVFQMAHKVTHWRLYVCHESCVVLSKPFFSLSPSFSLQFQSIFASIHLFFINQGDEDEDTATVRERRSGKQIQLDGR